MNEIEVYLSPLHYLHCGVAVDAAYIKCDVSSLILDRVIALVVQPRQTII